MKQNNKLLSYFIGILLLIVVFSTDIVVNGQTSITSNADCPYQPLPDDFMGMNYLGYNQEFHFLNTYYYSFKSFTKDIYFNLTDESQFRFYVAPSVVDVDVWLYNTATSKSITHSSDATSGLDEAIYADLPAGQYRVRLLFFGQNKASQLTCPTLTIEAAVSLSNNVQNKVSSFNCPAQAIFPDIDLSQFQNSSFYYDSDLNETGVIMNVVDQASTNGTTTVILKSYDIQLPQGTINTDKWGVEIILGTHFLTGGSLGLLIQDQLLPPPSNFSCIKAQNCSIAIHMAKGRSVLRNVFTPGNYTLYIYDTISEKNFTMAPACTPFSLLITLESAHETETFLNCPAVLLPDTFSQQGYLDDQGYMYFNDQVFLDLVKGSAVVPFTVSQASYFRAYIPVTRIDIDVQLSNSTNNIVSSYKWGGEEEITALIQPGDYNFTLFYFGKNIDIFCDTYSLEVGIIPQADYTDTNYCNGITTNNTPDLSDLPAQLTANQSYQFSSNSAFNFMFNNNDNQQNISTVTFTINDTYLFTGDLGSNFVLGDVRFILTNNPDENHDDPIVYQGTHDRNTQHMFVTMLPGEYTLSIVTGLTSKKPNLPACLPFTFSAQMILEDDTQDPPCWDNVFFPSDLNAPAYLGTSDKIHISGEFLIPPIKVLNANSNHAFTVRHPSFLRAYIPVTDIDVDIQLYQDDKLVTWSNSFGDEEPIIYMVQPGKAYRIQLKFFHWPLSGVISKNCYTYNIELSIAPQDENPNDTCVSELPPSTLIPAASLTPFYQIGQYKFPQTTTSFTSSYSFNVTGNLPAAFRAILTYDFTWNDIYMVLKGSNGQVLSYPDLGYNRVEINTPSLTAGQYTLVVYEPFDPKQKQFTLKNCVDFTLEVAIQLVDDEQVTQDTIVCPDILFPNSLNSPSYLSNLTGQTVFYQETVLADVVHGSDIITFTLLQASLIRVYIPVHTSLDIDVTLSFAGGKTIASSRTVGEEILYNTLNKGDYVLKFQYYAFGGPLPKVEDCVSFPTFISIAPTAALLANPTITNECDSKSTTLPVSLQGNTKFSGLFQRELDIKPASQTLGFSTTQVGHIQISLAYNDLVASLAMKLNGTIMVNGFATNKMIYPYYIGGQGFINEILPSGNWSLLIYDPYSTTSPVSQIQCAPFELEYYLNTSTPNNVDVCDDIFTLPTDLYSQNGGSYSYGGPQNSKGEIRLSFGHFFISPQPSQFTNRFLFKIPSKSVFLRFSSESDPGNDLDYHIYQNTNSTDALYSAWSQGTIESGVFALQPQNDPYVFEIKTISVNKKVPCNYFRLDFAIETSDHIIENLLCPAIMPNEVDQVPPESVDFAYGQDQSLGADNYLFSNARVQNNLVNGVFKYRMTYEFSGPAILYATIGFDFVTNDFNLVLSQKNSNTGAISVVSNGKDSIPTTVDSDINYQNIVQYSVTVPGVYYLDISEDMTLNGFNVTNGCHYFAFHVTVQSEADDPPPRIVSVTPPSVVDFDPNQPLNLKILFSDELSFNSTTQTLIQYIIAQKAVLMRSQTQTGLDILPTSATIKKSDKTNLQITFSGGLFNVSNDYLLVIDASQFKNPEGILFAGENNTYPHIYKMYDCDCNGNGKCVSTSGNTPMKCQCNDPWTGTDCSKCKTGYHGAGTNCVANTQCQPNSCNGNGKCNDDEGYPECQCSVGYASVNVTMLCGSCDFGYTGYPNCTLEQDDEGTLCTAPILPVSLNSIEYLGYTGSVHIQDDYYLDLASGSHSTVFTLQNTSLLRVYTEPHHVDVDLWLYSLNDDGSINDLIDKSLTFGHEEVLLDILPAGTYSLLYKYYLWDKIYTVDCETFNMELAIESLDDVSTDGANWISTCAKPDSVPSLSDSVTLIVNNTFDFYQPGTQFNVQVNNTKTSYYFWTQQITVIPPQDGQVAIFDAVASYQFLIGEISLVLQGGFGDAGTCRGSDISAVSGCVFGDNEMNRNAIHATLEPGNYTLFMYAPEFLQINLTCAIFNFEAHFKFIFDDEDYYNCDADLLPASLNSPEFLFNDFLHIQDTYLVETKHSNVSFNLAVTSYIRVVAEQSNANVSVLFVNANTGDVLRGTSMIVTKIAPGSYILSITSNYISTSKHFCPMMNLEIAIEPVATTLLFPPTCPKNNKDVLPVINTKVPFIFENGTKTKGVYYHFPQRDKPVVGVYTFTLAQVVYFYSAITSEFLRGDLRVNLYKQNSDSTYSLFITGTHDYNYNWIESNLDPATYQLKIERIATQSQITDFPDCIPFEFEFTLLGLSKVPQCSGEPIPLTLNGIRFLGTEGTMHYESDNFIVPTGSFTHKDIPLMVSSPSIIRVYVSPHVVDIDIKLIDPSTNATIISGSNGIGTEEAFITNLKAQYNYVLQIQFWKWSKNIPPCSNFNMELAIGPATPLVNSTCPNQGSDLWPKDFPKTFTDNQYSYNNLDSNEQLYFQQINTGNGLKSHSMPFTLSAISSIHTQVGYDFLTGELAVKIQSADKKKTYYGSNRPNRNSLDIETLPAGSYVLYIYEPYSSLSSIMGCSYFNFEVYIEPYSSMDQEDGFYHYMPYYLDAYSYLSYNRRTHLQGEYWMFDAAQGQANTHNTLKFTNFDDQLLIRVRANVLPADEANVYQNIIAPGLTLIGPDPFKLPATYGALIQTLTVQGGYSLTITQPFNKKLSNIAVDVEVAIQTYPQVTKQIQAITLPNNCTTSAPFSIIASPDGSFFFSDTLTIAQSDIINAGVVLAIPFHVVIPTLVYVQIGYQFILSDLDLAIKSTQGKSITVEGKHNRNLNEINVVLQPGSYEITVTNTLGFPTDLPEHCTPYRFSVMLRDAEDDDHVDCSLFTLVPWDLNSNDGGSVENGGPIDGSGTLNYYGNDFLVPTSLSTNISFGVNQPTLVNIFTSETISTNIDYDIYQLSGNTEQSLSYSSSIHNGNEKSYLYLINGNFEQPSKSNPIPPLINYYINLQYTAMAKGTCPAFSMQILMKPLSFLNKELACPAVVNPQLPSKVIVPDSHNSASEFISSYISGDYISKNTDSKGFNYYIDFNLKSSSRIEASFSFYSLASNFILNIASRSTSSNGSIQRSIIGTGDWSTQYNSGSTTLTQTISSSRLKSGNYSLIINQPQLTQPYFTASVYNDLCFPFIYSLLILDSKTVYAGQVSPSSGYNMPPNLDLTIQIQFSEPLYDQTQKQIQCLDAVTIRGSFYLVNKFDNTNIFPATVSCVQGDATNWQFVFPSHYLTAATSYQLGMNQLFDDSGAPAILPPQHFYSMIDTTCSSNGQYLDNQCICSNGYQGAVCDSCEAGFINTNPSGAAYCVTNQCKPDTCGCKPNITSTCVPLGTCHINTDTHLSQCTCGVAYNGSTCNRCADGYTNYPYCIPDFTCPGGCGKGKCDHNTGRCECPSNFEGPNCSDCVTGYSGNDCKKIGSGAIIALEVIAGLSAGAIVLGFGAWYIRQRFRAGVARYKMLPRFEIEDEYNDKGSKFPGLYEDSDEENNFDNKNYSSINSSAPKSGAKTHVFSFANQPSNSLMDTDSDEENNNNNNNNNNDNSFSINASSSKKSFFDM